MFVSMLAACLLAPQTGWVGPQEQRQGFIPLTLSRWKGWMQSKVPPAWSLEENDLVLTPGREGGDIETMDQFVNFDFRIDWNMSEGGNSGIMYRCSEQYDTPWFTGPEYQLLDNERHGDGRNPKTSAASDYALYPPTRNVCKPAGQWNSSRIVARGRHIEHWLNGEKVVDYTLESHEWEGLVKRSKFASLPRYGREWAGHIVLQDHGFPVRFKNIRIKRL